MKSKKIITFIFLITLTSALMTSCGKKDESSESEPTIYGSIGE